jgi:hypothetical protein
VPIVANVQATTSGSGSMTNAFSRPPALFCGQPLQTHLAAAGTQRQPLKINDKYVAVK